MGAGVESSGAAAVLLWKYLVFSFAPNEPPVPSVPLELELVLEFRKKLSRETDSWGIFGVLTGSGSAHVEPGVAFELGIEGGRDSGKRDGLGFEFRLSSVLTGLGSSGARADFSLS